MSKRVYHHRLKITIPVEAHMGCIIDPNTGDIITIIRTYELGRISVLYDDLNMVAGDYEYRPIQECSADEIVEWITSNQLPIELFQFIPQEFISDELKISLELLT